MKKTTSTEATSETRPGTAPTGGNTACAILQAGRAACLLGALLSWAAPLSAAGRPSPAGSPGVETSALNLVVVLDLSDRIDPVRNPGQAQQDLKILDGITSLFEESVRRKLYLFSRDRMVVTVAPQRTGYQGEVLSLADGLRIDMREINVDRNGRGRPGFDAAKRRLSEGLSRLYTSASGSTRYVGADIWEFFRDRLESYVTPEPGVRNVVVVVTDGYINFEKEEERQRPQQGTRTSYMRVGDLRADGRWEQRFDRENWGLISFGPRFRDVEIVVAGLRYLQLADQPIVERYWTGWLGEMGVSKLKLLPADDSVVPSIGILKRLLS